jgi:hypothetical protein
MNVPFSIYDVFANAIPGSLYLATSVYIGVRLRWVEMAEFANLNTSLALASTVVASYLLGQILGPTLRRLLERLHLWEVSTDEVRQEFRRRNPSVAARPFVEADPFTLLAGLRQHSADAAMEVDRSRAGGIMLRSTSPALFIGAATAWAELLVDGRPAAGIIGAALIMLSALSLLEGQRRNRWAQIHTYECAMWMQGVDESFTPDPDNNPKAPHTTRPTAS